MSAPSEERHRLKRAPVFKPHLADHTGVDGKLRPGKLAAQESAFLRRTGGVDVPRAPVMRGAKRIIAQTVPLIWAENRRFARRLELRGKHVPANLNVAPAHHWNISDEALDHIIALVDLTAKKMAKGAHTVAEFDGRKTIMSSDVRLARSLGEGQ